MSFTEIIINFSIEILAGLTILYFSKNTKSPYYIRTLNTSPKVSINIIY